MELLGRSSLLLALVVCGYGIAVSLYGTRIGSQRRSESGRRAVYALALVLSFAFGVLEVAFLTPDFAFDAVADTASTTAPTFYKAAAVWSSQEGSLLLWAWLLSMWSSLVLFLTRKQMREIAPYAQARAPKIRGRLVSSAGVELSEQRVDRGRRRPPPWAARGSARRG